MIEFKISAASAVAILAGVTQVSAHVRFLQSWGNYNHKVGGGCLGHLYNYPPKNYGHDQWPGQWDVIVYSDPVVPAWAPSPHVGKPRRWMSQGCGASLQTTYDYAYSIDPNRAAPPSLAKNWGELWKHRNYHVFMAPVHGNAYIQTKSAIMKEVAETAVSVLIYLTKTYQVNDDGAGPFRCRIDETGTGQNFADWVIPVRQPPGEHGKASIYPWTNNKQSIIRVNLPSNIKCQATYGKFKNVCILRCENYAPNGPFGGCVPFQVMYPEAAKPKPIPIKVEPKTPEPIPPKGDPGYNVGHNNYKENTYYRNRRRAEAMAGTVAIAAEEEVRKRSTQSTEGTDALAAEEERLGHGIQSKEAGDK
ncbi:hypothetical protein TWF730_010098 [Orbilia blumenaviensis]|uniref:Uncharacterized protein n=1 Tax=Orbilia blumenaviensis TaxID=1796055 RepID=A0AAV9UTP1_9PEZI